MAMDIPSVINSANRIAEKVPLGTRGFSLARINSPGIIVRIARRINKPMPTQATIVDALDRPGLL
jgi:hypothetical protein